MTSSRTALPREFYAQDTLDVGRSLLNCLLVRNMADGLVIGRISETEAYRQDEPSSHSFRGRTPRNAVMFGPPGYAYVYFTYGMHFCCNVVTAEEGVANAVLVRAVEPVLGWELMSRRRGLGEEEIARLSSSSLEPASRVRWGRTLCGGPGRLCQAFAIGRAENGADLTALGAIWIAPAAEGPAPGDKIIAGPRIGIRQATELPWRFTLRDDPYTSRR